MASIPYETILSSDFFKFVVGPEKKELHIHSAIVAAQSQSLYKLVNGDMKEARERRAVWKHVDLQTFLRFSEFAYTGDYREAESRGRDRDSLVAAEEERLLQAFLYSGPEEKQQREPLWDKFKKLYPDPKTKSGKGSSGSGSSGSSSSRAGVYRAGTFLSHAKMYVFADYHDIAALRSLSLRKLRGALEHAQLREEQVGDITQLVRYCYENTMDRGGQTDRLRSLVNVYTACKVEELWKHKDFCSLVETNGEYSKGLITEMMGRLV